jgi:O-succinylbenzoic acid--CoA ligase
MAGDLIGRTAHTSRKLLGVPDLVAIDLPGGPDFVDALRTIWDRGDAALALDQRLSAPAQASVLDRLRPARVRDAGGEHLCPGGIPVEPGDALVLATSGTTGAPKGVVLTHAAVESSARATSSRLAVLPDRHRWLACLPLNHVGGLSVVTRSLVTGTPVQVLPGFDREEVLAASGPEVLVSLVPTALRRLGAAHFHTVLLGGSHPPTGLAPNVVSTYGLTETGSGVVYDGVPLEGVEVAVDEETSEIRVRGPMLLRAYRDGTDPFDEGGWFATGDSGELDADGRLHVRGRIAELIISGGENIWPASVEAVLRRHPAVADVAVAGRPDPDWGQRVVAWIVPADPRSPPALAELRATVASLLAPYAAPRQLVLVDRLPKTGLGKVWRDHLPDPDPQLPTGRLLEQ